ncbi:MAG: amidohydrolase family protein [Planctomycetaceae bacterium]|nr:amidohydrolase family protein [Planctomycetaceae bacterium]
MTSFDTCFANPWNELAGARRLHVRWLLRPDDAPLRNVEVVVESGFLTEVRHMPESVSHRADPVVLMPALVNAHTHLEFSDLDTPVSPALPFQDWITSVIQNRRNRSAVSTPLQGLADASIMAGLSESRKFGTLATGEITTQDLSVDLWSRFQQTSTISFRECIGLQPESIQRQIENAQLHLKNGVEGITGLSPHAPYTVHPELFDELIRMASRHCVPVAMHLGETIAERQLLLDATGAFRSFLSERQLWNASAFPASRTLLNYLKPMATLRRALAIHCNYLSEPEMEFLAENPNVAVVFCPRTHQFFQHGSHPWRRLRDAGARVVLGTDSRASNPDLSIWRELLSIVRQHEGARQVSLDGIARHLPMITTDSADALGLNSQHFALQCGQPFHAVAVPMVPETGAIADMPAAVFHCGERIEDRSDN